MVGNSNERLSHGQSSFSSFEQYCRSLRKSINRPDSGKIQTDWWDKGQGGSMSPFGRLDRQQSIQISTTVSQHEEHSPCSTERDFGAAVNLFDG